MTLSSYLQNYIQEHGLQNALATYTVSVELTDRNGRHVSDTSLTVQGYAQQEDILDAMAARKVISPMSDYYFLNWPKSIKLLVCELGVPGEVIHLHLIESLMCPCPE